MKTTNVMGMLALVLAISAVQVGAESGATKDGNCNDTNYGVQVNNYIIANRDCSWYEDNDRSYHQVCDSTTKTGFGAGSGAGHGGQTESAANMELTAGTQCTNGDSGESTL